MLVLADYVSLILTGLAAYAARFSRTGRSAIGTSIYLACAISAVAATLNIVQPLANGRTINMLVAYFDTAALFCWLIFFYVTTQLDAVAQTKRKSKELQALNDIACAVGRSMDLPQILNSALLSVLKIGNFEYGFIYLLNEEKNLLELSAVHGEVPPDLAQKLATLKLGQEV